MRTVLIAVMMLMVCHISAAPIPKETDAAKAELEKLNGTWEVTSIKIQGLEMVDKLGEKLFITFKNGEFTWSNGEQPGKIVFIDPAKTPKQIDYTYTEGRNKSKTQKAIYKLDGDTFTDCFGDADDDARPKDFTSTKDNEQTVMVYKRVKKKID
jgi:uncharacterized protein (TIGR03067 family)